jgi:hypothetical protein
MAKLRMDTPDELNNLMDAARYTEMIKEVKH